MDRNIAYERILSAKAHYSGTLGQFLDEVTSYAGAYLCELTDDELANACERYLTPDRD